MSTSSPCGGPSRATKASCVPGRTPRGRPYRGRRATVARGRARHWRVPAPREGQDEGEGGRQGHLGSMVRTAAPRSCGGRVLLGTNSRSRRRMHLVAAGLTYRSAPLSVRDRVAVDEDGLDRLLGYLTGHCGLSGAAVLDLQPNRVLPQRPDPPRWPRRWCRGCCVISIPAPAPISVTTSKRTTAPPRSPRSSRCRRSRAWPSARARSSASSRVLIAAPRMRAPWIPRSIWCCATP